MGDTNRSIDPRLLSVEQAAVALTDANAIRNMAATLAGKLARRVTEGTQWQRAGFASPEAWLAQQSGTSAAKAKEAMETAERLESLPAVSEAAARGELSVEQVAMIADAAAANPGAERRLLGSAKVRPIGKLREECALVKRAADPDAEATYARIRAARILRFSTALDGAARLFGVTTPDQIAPIKAAVEKRADELFDQARRDGRHEPHEAYLMDALEHICRDWLNGESSLTTSPTTDDPARADTNSDALTDSPSPFGSAPDDLDIDERAADVGDLDIDVGDPRCDEATPDGGPATAQPTSTDRLAGEQPAPTNAPAARARRPLAPGWLGLLRIDVEALYRGAVEGEELCEITGVGPVPVSAAQRLLGDALLKLVITRGVDVLNVTHVGRHATVAQQTALLWSSPGCCVTSCHRMAGIEIDHRIDWADTHHTVLDELQRCCDHHHDLKTREGWATIRLSDGTIDMVPPTDPRHPDRADQLRAGPDPPGFDEPESELSTLFDHTAA